MSADVLALRGLPLDQGPASIPISDSSIFGVRSRTSDEYRTWHRFHREHAAPDGAWKVFGAAYYKYGAPTELAGSLAPHSAENSETPFARRVAYGQM